MAATRQRRQSAVNVLAQEMQAAINRGDTTIVKMASATGLSRMQLYRIMDGTTDSPSMKNAEAIAKHLGLKIIVQHA